MKIPGHSARGSILIIMLITLLFTAMALIAFLDRASNDLLVEAHATVAKRLRVDAYSALEVTFAVLQDFQTVDSGLHSPSEGWNDPLGWAGWAPSDGTTVEVSFEDESGKVPLAHVDSNALVNMFEYWKMQQADAQRLADALLTWMQRDYVSSSGELTDYEEGVVPYNPPQRSLRSYDELAAIDVVREMFYDNDGRPNELWWRFIRDFSLFSYKLPNINGANEDVLGGLGQFSDDQRQSIADLMVGIGGKQVATPLGKQWFNATSDVTGLVGAQGNSTAFGTTIQALRVFVTVHEGSSVFHLAVVAAPSGGATTVQTTATEARKGQSSAVAGATAPDANAPAAPQNPAAVFSPPHINLRYPFTILEIRENDEILNPPPPISS